MLKFGREDFKSNQKEKRDDSLNLYTSYWNKIPSEITGEVNGFNSKHNRNEYIFFKKKQKQNYIFLKSLMPWTKKVI